MAQFTITLSDGTVIWNGDSFEWRGKHYRLDKINPVKVKMTEISNGKKWVLDKMALERSAMKSEIKMPAEARGLAVEMPVIPTLKEGMAVSYQGHAGIWVITKYQRQTDRYDITLLGGMPEGSRNSGFRTPASYLTPLDAINSLQSV